MNSKVILISLLFLNIPLSLLFRYLPSPELRKAFSSLVSLAELVILYGAHNVLWFGLFGLVTYTTVKFCPQAPWLTSSLSLMVVLYSHQTEVWNSVEDNHVNASTAVMMMVSKIGMFSFHVSDGLRIDPSLPEKFRIMREESVVDIRSVSLVDYFIYLFDCFGVLVGPVFEYNELQRFFSATDLPVADPVYLKRKVGHLLFFSVFFLATEVFLPRSLLTDPSISLPMRLVVTVVTGFALRAMYYAVWSLSEIPVILSGLGPAGEGSNVDPVACESMTRFSELASHWNHRIGNRWLKNCVYSRIPSRRIANLSTKIVSAVWHGVHPGYYITFLSAFLVDMADSALDRIGGVPVWARRVYRWTTMSFYFIPFALLSWDLSVQFLRSVYFLHFALDATIILVAQLLPRSKKN